MRALHRRVDDVAVFRRQIDADGAARLHRGRGDAVDDETVLDDVRGLGEGGVGRGLVADQLDETDVVGAAFPDFGGARFGRLGGGDGGGQRLVFNLDQFGGVRCLCCGFRDHEGDRIADPAHAVLRQYRIGRLEHRRAIAALEAAMGRQFAKARLLPVGRRDDGKHARRGLGGVGLDRQDFRVAVRRAQHDAERHAGIDRRRRYSGRRREPAADPRSATRPDRLRIHPWRWIPESQVRSSPAKAGTHGELAKPEIVALDSRLRGNERNVNRALRKATSRISIFPPRAARNK